MFGNIDFSFKNGNFLAIWISQFFPIRIFSKLSNFLVLQ